MFIFLFVNGPQSLEEIQRYGCDENSPKDRECFFGENLQTTNEALELYITSVKVCEGYKISPSCQ